MASTEGSQRYINKSILHSIDIRQSPTEDFFRLHINSNDTYSGWLYSNNNCYDITIEFPKIAQNQYNTEYHNATDTK